MEDEDRKELRWEQILEQDQKEYYIDRLILASMDDIVSNICVI